MNKWLNFIQHRLYPPTCLLCGEPGDQSNDLCNACHHSLPWADSYCPCCGISQSTSNTFCGLCQKKTPNYDRITPLFEYREPVRHLIHTLKFSTNYPSGRLLGNLMAKKFSTTEEKPQRLIPVPLHRKRYHQRGFNQAIEIAQPIARQLNIPLDTACCRRQLNTTAQAELHANERRRNIRGAFQVRHDIDYKHVAIIDDVVTTGATVNELAKVLRKEGVTKIEVWCCARA